MTSINNNLPKIKIILFLHKIIDICFHKPIVCLFPLILFNKQVIVIANDRKGVKAAPLHPCSRGICKSICVTICFCQILFSVKSRSPCRGVNPEPVEGLLAMTMKHIARLKHHIIIRIQYDRHSQKP